MLKSAEPGPADVQMFWGGKSYCLLSLSDLFIFTTFSFPVTRVIDVLGWWVHSLDVLM